MQNWFTEQPLHRSAGGKRKRETEEKCLKALQLEGDRSNPARRRKKQAEARCAIRSGREFEKVVVNTYTNIRTHTHTYTHETQKHLKVKMLVADTVSRKCRVRNGEITAPTVVSADRSSRLKLRNAKQANKKQPKTGLKTSTYQKKVKKHKTNRQTNKWKCNDKTTKKQKHTHTHKKS